MSPMNHRLMRPRASGGFDPRTVSGLAAWWDASDSSTITLNGSTVSQWRDKSGNSRTLSQSTAANQPSYSENAQNGKPGIIFDKSNTRHLSYSSGMFTFAGAGTVFVVTTALSKDLTDYGSFISEGTSVAARKFVSVQPGAFNVAGIRPATDIYGPHGVRTTSSFTGANAFVFQWKWDDWSTHRTSAGTVIGVNNDSEPTSIVGSQDPQNFTNDTRQFFVGLTGNQVVSGACLTATVCEILAYTVALGATQRASVRSYLGVKWGITVT